MTGEHMTSMNDDIQKAISGLAECAAIIDQTIAEGDRSDIYLGIVRANVSHIGVVCDRDEIKQSGADLTEYRNAQLRGIVWLDQN